MQAHTPFIINLDTHPRGYTFHSLQQTASLPSKSKKAKAPPPKSPHSKITNRLIKEIGLTSEIPPVIPEQNPYSKEIVNQTEQLPKVDLDFQEEEEFQCQVKRQAPLPESPAVWFSLEQIHQIEIDTFSQFFTGQGYKTPELYQAYRNFIVEAYRHNPRRYLSFIACRRVLKGDVNCLLKIYQFLGRQGIINYGLGPDGNYEFKSLSLAQISEMGKKPQSCLKKIPEKPELEETSELDTDNMTVTVINKNFSRSYRVYCQECKLICGIVWYTLPLDEDRSRNICIDCFNRLDKEQSSGYIKADITKKLETIKDNRSVGKSNWGLEDNVKLLDFMGSCQGKSWSDIESQFQTRRGVEDIILQFMQFPISNFDPYSHQAHLTHGKVQYSHSEYINLLDDLYKASPYALKKEEVTVESQPVFTPSPPLKRFKAVNNMLLSKVGTKIEELKAIQTIWQETNLKVRQQNSLNRIHPARPQQKVQISEDSFNDEE